MVPVHDLIANALILEEIGLTNADADAVLQRWYDQKPVSVADETAEVMYDFVTYLNTVKDARLESGTYLSFQQYKELGVGQTASRPYQVKRVLEDGLLGTFFQFSDAIGKKAPQLDGTDAAYGEDIVFSCSTDPLYLNADVKLYLDGVLTPLRNDDYLSQYSYNSENNTITIYSRTKGTAGGDVLLTSGTHKLQIESEGYQTATITLNVTRSLEVFELSLEDPNPAAGETAEDPSVYYTGQDVYVNAACGADDEEQAALRGDFMKNLTGIEMKYPDGTTHKINSTTEGSIFGDDNYIANEFGFVLQKGLFKEAGNYILTVWADEYTPKILEFTIEEGKENPDDGGEETETLTAPKASGVEYKTPIIGNRYYQVSFEGDEEAVAAYLAVLADREKEVSVQVNGTEYTYTGSFWNDTSKYTVSKDSSYGGKDRYLDFTEDGFVQGVNTIVIQAEGYEDQTIAILVEGRIASIVDPDDGAEELLKAPDVDETNYAYNILFGSYYRVTFTGISTEELETYLKKLKDTEIAAVTVNGQAYEPAGSLFGSEMSYVISSNPYGESVYLDLTEDGFTADVNEIVIQVEGYEDLTFEVEKESDDEEETLLTFASYGQEEDNAKDETDYAGKPEAGETEMPEEDEKPEEGTETEEGQKPEEGAETEEDEKTGEESNEDKEPEDSDQNSQDQEDEGQNSQKPEIDDSSLEEKDDLEDDIQDPEDEADEDGDAEELEAGDGEEESDGEEAEDDSQTPDEETDADEDSQNAEADGDEDADQQ